MSEMKADQMLFTLPDHTADKHLFLGTGAKPRTIHSKPNENCTARTNSNTLGNIMHLIREYPCVLIESDDTYGNSVRKITSVMISFACLFARGRLM